MTFSRLFYVLLFGCFINPAWLNAQQKKNTFFKVIPLGVKGGLDESNLSAYLIANANSDDYVCVDAGTIRYGIEKAINNGLLKEAADKILKYYIKAYLISHAHLDHVAGLILNAPNDTAKNIYALPFVINTLKDKYFTWQNWANFADVGDKPTLNKYHYINLKEEEDTTIANTGLHVRAFPLSHSNPGQSTAFLLNNNNHFLLYLGDTGADSIEGSNKLYSLWKYVAPIIKSHRLKAIFIEVSYLNEQPDSQLFGHLTPHWLMEEMKVLAMLTGTSALKNVPIVITHIKPSKKSEKNIKAQLKKENKLQLKLLYPKQGMLLKF